MPRSTRRAGMKCPATGRCSSRLFALHGYGGHGIGLEVHDPAQYYEGDNRFGAGDVFTVEPGLYVSPDLLGSLPDTPKNREMLAKIRPRGGEVQGHGRADRGRLRAHRERDSSGFRPEVPREITEIEALMQQPSRSSPAEAPADGRRDLTVSTTDLCESPHR